MWHILGHGIYNHLLVLLPNCKLNSKFLNNIDLSNYRQKKSIINIQDLGLSATSQHSVGGQPILWGIFRKFFILKKYFILRIFSIFRFLKDLGGQLIP